MLNLFLKKTIILEYIHIVAPLWQEIFLLLICLLTYSNDNDCKDLNLRLILNPLSSITEQFISILIKLVDLAEFELIVNDNSSLSKISSTSSISSLHDSTTQTGLYK